MKVLLARAFPMGRIGVFNDPPIPRSMRGIEPGTHEHGTCKLKHGLRSRLSYMLPVFMGPRFSARAESGEWVVMVAPFSRR